MHIPDGFLNNGLAGGFCAAAAAMLVFCAGKVFKTAAATVTAFAGVGGAAGSVVLSKGNVNYYRKLAIIAVWVFACQMFNITVASATSVHLLGGVFAAVLAGPFAGFIIMSSVLIVQSLFFADGGFLALGTNIFNIAFVGSFLAYYVYKALSSKNYYFAVAAACFFSVLAAALTCLAELGISGSVSFGQAFKDMTTLHFLFAIVETGITLILLKMFGTLEIADEN
jgi:cobalt/nickel transport system permease protein